jgi:hypothetical protein
MSYRLGHQPMALLIGGRTFTGRRKLGHWEGEVSLKEILGPCPIPVSSVHSDCNELGSFFYHVLLPHHKPQNNRANQPWTETSKTVSQNKLFLLVS